MAELKAYVQKVADADMENGAALIQSAGMNVKKTAVRPPRVFAITQGPGPVSGTVRVVAPKAADRAAYDWEWSTDGGKTWQIAPSTLRATTQKDRARGGIDGLVPLPRGDEGRRGRLERGDLVPGEIASTSRGRLRRVSQCTGRFEAHLGIDADVDRRNLVR